jgi:hypothetical protein
MDASRDALRVCRAQLLNTPPAAGRILQIATAYDKDFFCCTRENSTVSSPQWVFNLCICIICYKINIVWQLICPRYQAKLYFPYFSLQWCSSCCCYTSSIYLLLKKFVVRVSTSHVTIFSFIKKS